MNIKCLLNETMTKTRHLQSPIDIIPWERLKEDQEMNVLSATSALSNRPWTVVTKTNNDKSISLGTKIGPNTRDSGGLVTWHEVKKIPIDSKKRDFSSQSSVLDGSGPTRGKIAILLSCKITHTVATALVQVTFFLPTLVADRRVLPEAVG
jgi:hypothetical protein